MDQESTLILVERDSNGKKRELRLIAGKKPRITSKNFLQPRTSHQDAKDFLTRVFLPAGYPKTVTPDYLRYQILNALQAFCNSLASLLASRAVLEGIGVGNPSATSTQAMLLSVLQDAFGRIATIVGAYCLGTLLVPEAKAYRFLADVLNDLAVIVDVFSPILSTQFFPGARVVGLCTSAALKSLCGIVAGGSKTAITMHFATPSTGMGDLGDLNAKDSSKETVLALVGMLLGSVVVPLISSLWATYTFLFILVLLHLGINYFAVRGITLRHLNKQRAAIAWLYYKNNHKAPSPAQVAGREFIFDRPGTIRDPETRQIIGQCHIGSAPTDVLRGPTLSLSFLEIFQHRKYILCFDPTISSLNTTSVSNAKDLRPIIHVCFRENFTTDDQLAGWLHAVELCRLVFIKQSSVDLTNPAVQLDFIKASYEDFPATIVKFREELQRADWNMTESYLISGLGPTAVLSAVTYGTEKKVE